MAKQQRKAGAAELVALVAIGTVLHDGETYVDGESLTVDAATAARLIEVGGAKLEGEIIDGTEGSRPDGAEAGVQLDGQGLLPASDESAPEV